MRSEINAIFKEKGLEYTTEQQEQKKQETTIHDVLFPLVNVSIEEKQAQMYGRASGVRIHNPDDAVEVAIKNNIVLNKPYKSWNAIFREIGAKILYDAGILDLNQSFYKRKAQDLLSCYGEFKLTGKNKYERCCTVLHEKPRFELEIPTRGNRYYRDRGVPLLLRFLKKEFVINDTRTYYTSPETLAIAIGLVNGKFNARREAFKKENQNLTGAMVEHFYLHCKPELNKVIYSLLDELQNRHEVIHYQKLHWITFRTSGVRCSDDVDEAIIKEAENHILERDFQTKKISNVFFRRKKEQFYTEVVKYINQKYKLDWYSYKRTIKIVNINDEKIMSLLKKMPTDAAVLRKIMIEINQRFLKRMRKKIHADYDKTNQDADKKDKEYKEEPEKTDLYKKFCKMGYSHEDAIQKVRSTRAFRVHENCYEYQDMLMNLVIKIEK